MASAETVLNRQVLLLNAAFQVVMVIRAQRALTMLAKGTAKAVDHTDPHSYETFTWSDWTAMRPQKDDDVVRSASGEFVVPRVIQALQYKKQPKRGVTCSRLNIHKRDAYRCQYCGKKAGTHGLTMKDMTLDHVVPRSQGGEFNFENIVCSCYDCNQKKAGRTPRQAGMTLLRKPERPQWRPLYADQPIRYKSWEKFIEDIYWTVPMQP